MRVDRDERSAALLFFSSSWRIGLSLLVLVSLVSWGGLVSATPVDDRGLSFSGRVIDKETNRPVAGALVFVVQSTPVAKLGETQLRTDPEGRFLIQLTAEQAAEPGLMIALSKVEHPDFVPRLGYAVPLANLLQGQKFGDRPYFETVTLERGLEFSGEVVRPDGKPAADVSYEFSNWSGNTNRADHFSNHLSGKTDAEGRFRHRMPETQSLSIRIMPANFAPFQKFWGTDRPSANPDVFAPTELGRLVLAPGPMLSGRAVGISGQPIAGLRVVAQGSQNQVRREATTAADGSFQFAPLRPGNYDIFAEGQLHSASIDPIAPAMPATAPVIRPLKIYFSEGQVPSPVELRELPAVCVEVRFVDAQGNPARGGLISLSGGIPSEADRMAGDSPSMIDTSAVNEAEPEDNNKRLGWGCQLAADPEGRVVFRVPRGLTDVNFYTTPPDETVAFRTRLEKGGAIRYWGGGHLGTLDADRSGIEILCYRAPTVIATVKTEDGEPIPDLTKVGELFEVRGGSYGGNFVRQADGRFRSKCLMPDHEYSISFGSRGGYIPKQIEWVNLPEGATVEMALVMRKQPEPPALGGLAPPFAVETVDGQILSLADFRGKYLLIHAWSPFFRGDRDILRLEAIRKRFGKDRIGMLGLALTADGDEARRIIKASKITWPQAILRNAGADPIIQDFGGLWPPKSILIGPDGRIVAKDLAVEKIEELLARALGEK